MTRRAVAAGLLAVVGSAWAGSAQGPEAARVSGVVLTADEAPEPVRRAVVSLWGGDHPLGHHAITDGEGRFDLDGVRPGRYTLSAARPSYVTIEYGATLPGRPGTPLALAGGDHARNLRVFLARGAVITGTIRDAGGHPWPHVSVRVGRLPTPGGSQPPARFVRADDEGVYRAFGLAAGAYVVSARPDPVGAQAMIVRRDAEVDEALRRLRTRGPTAPAMSAVPAPAPEAPRTASDFVPIFFPGVFDEADAAPVTVRAGEERMGVDITVVLMGASEVVGRVVAGDPRLLEGVEVALSRAAGRRATAPATVRVRADGTFRFASVTPGAYRVVARALPAGVWSGLLRAPAGGALDAQPGACRAGAVDVHVSGGVSDVTVPLAPCPLIEGRVIFDGDVAAGDRAGIQVGLEPDLASDPLAMVPLRAPAVTAADGRFRLGEFGDVLPGRYVVRVLATARLDAAGWTVDAVAADGRDVLDRPLEVTGAMPAVTRMDVTFTRLRASVSGRIARAGGGPAAAVTVVAFPTNRDWWREPFRRVRASVSATDGGYVLADLPPGEYYLAAVTDVEAAEWRDAAFLDAIAGAAIRVTVAPGEARVQDLRMIR